MKFDAPGRQPGSRLALNSEADIVACGLVVAEIANDAPIVGGASPIPLEDAFHVRVRRPDHLDSDLQTDDESVSSGIATSEISRLHRLSRASIVELRCPSGGLRFYLPRAALDEIGDHVREQRVHALYIRRGRAHEDPVMQSLCRLLLLSLAKPKQVNRTFVDHIGHALRAHIAGAYGAIESACQRERGGLAPWQERRAKDALSRDLYERVSRAQVARECGLSVSHFNRAFRQSLGITPHQWLVGHRLARAKDQLLNTRASLAEVATDCGFADQSHFTRVFTNHEGSSPGKWRRRHTDASGS
jgi:AraC-like DNA-binding protein